MLYLCLRTGGGHKSLISRVSPLNPLNRFQSGFISFTLVVLNECEGPHCRTLQNFLITQSLSHLITCQKKRFFASAQNDEKPVIASEARQSILYFIFYRLLRRFTPRNDEKTFIPSGSYQYGSIIAPHPSLPQVGEGVELIHLPPIHSSLITPHKKTFTPNHCLGLLAVQNLCAPLRFSLEKLRSVRFFTGTCLDLTSFGRRTCQNPLITQSLNHLSEREVA